MAAEEVKRYRVQALFVGGDHFVELSSLEGSSDLSAVIQHAKDMKAAAPLNTYRVVDQHNVSVEVELPDSYRVQVETTPEVIKVWENSTGPAVESYDAAVAEVAALKAASPSLNCRIIDLQGNVITQSPVDRDAAAKALAERVAADEAAAAKAAADQAAVDAAAAAPAVPAP